jgi:hypothetical protein
MEGSIPMDVYKTNCENQLFIKVLSWLQLYLDRNELSKAN